MSMFGSSKPTASLSSALLARKGHARPAMRPQGFIQLSPGQPLDDLGWNDMGEESFEPAPPPAPATILPPPEGVPPVLRQRAVLDEQFSAPAEPEPLAAAEPEEEAAPAPMPLPRPAAKPRAVPAPVTLSPDAIARVAREARAKKSKAAFTLRLDHERHLRLRLATAVSNQSAQMLVTQALDAFLDSMAEVDALARQLAEREGGN